MAIGSVGDAMEMNIPLIGHGGGEHEGADRNNAQKNRQRFQRVAFVVRLCGAILTIFAVSMLHEAMERVLRARVNDEFGYRRARVNDEFGYHVVHDGISTMVRLLAFKNLAAAACRWCVQQNVSV